MGMTTASWSESRCAQYEFSIELSASTQTVWQVLTSQISEWWLPAYHILGPDSIVELELFAGGRLFEKNTTAELLWFTVIALEQEQSLDLAGFCSPKYGGPATTLLNLQVVPHSQQVTELKISDSLFGKITEGFVQSLMAGWQELFTQGLQKYIAESSRPRT
jgi:uncharacterized protein YndB with AHSA1/START domain